MWCSLAGGQQCSNFVVFCAVQLVARGARDLIVLCRGCMYEKSSSLHFCSSSLPLRMKFKLFCVSQNSVDYINTCSAFGPRMWFTFMSDGVHLRPT